MLRTLKKNADKIVAELLESGLTVQENLPSLGEHAPSLLMSPNTLNREQVRTRLEESI